MVRRPAFTLLETLVTIGIIAVVMGLFLPAIMRIREAAIRVECLNKFRQLGIAVHQYAGDRAGQLPSIQGSFNEDVRAGLFFHLLPYLEHGDYYAQVNSKKIQQGNNFVMKPCLCPLDPTLPPTPTGLASHAANAEVFKGRTYLSTYRDGSSNTIAFAEHYAWQPVPAGSKTQFDWYFDSKPERIGNTIMRRATFADRASGDVYPTTAGNPPLTIGSVPGLTFQVRPRVESCDPRIAQSAHPAGMLVGMGDGSVRTLRQGIAPHVYWALVTPAGGELVQLDD